MPRSTLLVSVEERLHPRLASTCVRGRTAAAVMSAVIRGSGCGVLAGVAVPVGLGLDQRARGRHARGTPRARRGTGSTVAVAEGPLIHLGAAPGTGHRPCSTIPRRYPADRPHTSSRGTHRGHPTGPRLPRRRPTPAGLRPPRRRLPPRDRGPGEHARGVPARGRRSATPTSRPTSTSPATACCWPSTTRSSTGSPTGTGSIAELDVRRGAAGADRRPRAGPDPGRAVRRVPRRPLQHRPQVRGRGPVAGATSSRSARPGTGCWSARSPRRRITRFRRLTGGRVATSAAPAARWSPSGSCPAPGSPAAHRGGRSPRCRSRTAAVRLRRRHAPAWYVARTRPASTCTCGPIDDPTR